MSGYLTEIGEGHQGQQVNSDPTKALKYKHDLLRLAVDYRMDVYMLCGSLRPNLRENRYKQVTGHTFADSIREVLQARMNVSILLWSENVDEQMAPSLMRLLAEAPEHADWGKLDVRISGTTSGDDKLTHFAVAKSRDERGWAVRVERPHRSFSDEEWEAEARVPAAILFRTPDAEKIGRDLLTMFNKLFEAVPDRNYEVTVPV